MKKFLSIGLAAIIIVTVGSAFLYHKKEMKRQENEYENMLTDREDSIALLQKLIEENEDQLAKYVADLDNVNKNNESLKKQIQDMITVPEIKLSSATVKESVKTVGELATKEYAYTNIGSIDEHDNIKIFFDTGIAMPFTHKSAIVSMDGKIKVGIDMDQVEIDVNNFTRFITITIPKAKILSNELDEKSAKVYDETTELFSNITIEDNGKIRQEIKNGAIESVKKSNIFNEADEQAELMITNVLQAVPYVKDYYKIKYIVQDK